jgi:single-stranded DNA-binding protein
VAVEGRIQVRSYVKDGETRTFTEVIADNVQMLGRRETGAVPGSGFEAATADNGKPAVEEPMTSEVPF